MPATTEGVRHPRRCPSKSPAYCTNPRNDVDACTLRKTIFAKLVVRRARLTELYVNEPVESLVASSSRLWSNGRLPSLMCLIMGIRRVSHGHSLTLRMPTPGEARRLLLTLRNSWTFRYPGGFHKHICPIIWSCRRGSHQRQHYNSARGKNTDIEGNYLSLGKEMWKEAGALTDGLWRWKQSEGDWWKDL